MAHGAVPRTVRTHIGCCRRKLARRSSARPRARPAARPIRLARIGARQLHARAQASQKNGAIDVWVEKFGESSEYG